MKSRATTRRLVVLTAIGLIALMGALTFWAITTASQASDAYHRQRQLLDVDLRAASAQGYTAQDLAPITVKVRALDAATAPLW